MVFGIERCGKSTWTFQQAKYIDPNFNIDRICFTPKQFLEQIRIAPPGGVVVFDEAFRGFSSKSSLSKINKLLVQAMMEVGMRNLIIFIVLPSFYLLENYIAIHRSHALFQIYEKKDYSYRGWRGYNRKKKAKIYYRSKRDYGIIPYTPTKLKGKFFVRRVEIDGKKVPVPYKTFDIQAYNAKKLLSFGGAGEEKEENPALDTLNELRYTLRTIKFPIKTAKDFTQKVGMSYSAFMKWNRYKKEENGSVNKVIV